MEKNPATKQKVNVWKIPTGIKCEDWIDAVVEAFCDSFGYFEKVRPVIKQVVNHLYYMSGTFWVDTYGEGWERKISEASSAVCFNDLAKLFTVIYKLEIADGYSCRRRLSNITREMYEHIIRCLTSIKYDSEPVLCGTGDGVCIDAYTEEDINSLSAAGQGDERIRKFLLLLAKRKDELYSKRESKKDDPYAKNTLKKMNGARVKNIRDNWEISNNDAGAMYIVLAHNWMDENGVIYAIGRKTRGVAKVYDNIVDCFAERTLNPLYRTARITADVVRRKDGERYAYAENVTVAEEIPMKDIMSDMNMLIDICAMNLHNIPYVGNQTTEFCEGVINANPMSVVYLNDPTAEMRCLAIKRREDVYYSIYEPEQKVREYFLTARKKRLDSFLKEKLCKRWEDIYKPLCPSYYMPLDKFLDVMYYWTEINEKESPLYLGAITCRAVMGELLRGKAVDFGAVNVTKDYIVRRYDENVRQSTKVEHVAFIYDCIDHKFDETIDFPKIMQVCKDSGVRIIPKFAKKYAPKMICEMCENRCCYGDCEYDKDCVKNYYSHFRPRSASDLTE